MSDAENNQPSGYVPPKIWCWDADNGGGWSGINRPISGATEEKDLVIIPCNYIPWALRMESR